MIDTQKRLYGNEPWFIKQDEMSRREVLVWMASLDPEDVHFTLYMYHDGGWKERIERLDSDRAKMRTQSERSARRPLARTTATLQQPVDRGSAIVEQLLKDFQEAKGYACSDPKTLKKHWKDKSRKNKLWALYSEVDIDFTMQSYYESKEEEAKQQRAANIVAAMQPKPKAKPVLRTLPPNFTKTYFPDYKKNKLVFSLIKKHHKETKAYSNNPSVLFQFWDAKDKEHSSLKASMTEADQIKLQKWRETMSIGEGSSSVKQLIDNFFSRAALLARVCAVYEKLYGFPADTAKKALLLWRKLEPTQKYEAGVHYEPETELKDFLLTHFRKEPAPPPESKPRSQTNPELVQRLARSKSRWTLEENIAVLAKRFPYDPTLKHMLHRERSLTPHVRYASEYDVFAPEEENLRKMRLRTSLSGSPRHMDRKLKDEHMRMQADKIKILENQAGQEEAKLKQEVGRMYQQVRELAKSYLEKREHGRPSVTRYLGAAYTQLKAACPKAVQRTFPFANYGSVKAKGEPKSTCNSHSVANAYPLDFKIFFFQTVRGFLKTKAGSVFLRSLPSNTWAPPSRDKCTIHTNCVCPPNCQYLTHNRAALKQTFQHMKLNLSFFDQLKPWRRPDTQQQRSKIFMSFSDVRECIFEPVIGSRVPKKEMDLATSLYPGVNQVFANEKADFDLWVGKLGKNFAARDPLLYKTGLYKKARVLYQAGRYQLMLELLNDHFNIPSIRTHFSGDKTIPPDAEKPAENFNDPHSRELMEKVFELVNSVQVERKNMNFLITLLNREDKGAVMQDMCPYGAQCPLNSGDKKTCTRAHHTFELRFPRENASRRKAREKAITRLNLLMGSNLERRPWVPDGRVQECQNCKVTFVSNALMPSQEKGNSCKCNKCALEQRLRDKEKMFQALSRKRQLAKTLKAQSRVPVQPSPAPSATLPAPSQSYPLSQSLPPKPVPSPAKQIKLQEKHVKYSKKLGLYRRANTLFTTGRLGEAWTAAQEALTLVRQDREAEAIRVEEKKAKWQRLLGVKDDNVEGEGGASQRSATYIPGQSLADFQNLSLYRQKLQKLSLPNSNHFLNHQIDLLALNLHATILAQKRNIQRLYEAAEMIEDRKDEVAEDPKKLPPLLRPKKTQMCEHILAKKKCPHGAHCDKAHTAIELDLVSSEKVMQHMRQTVEAQEMALKMGGGLQSEAPPVAHSVKELPEVMQDLTKQIDLTKSPFDS